MTIHDFAQRSPEWEAIRLGKLTGTGADPMLATNRDGKPSAGRKNLLTRLVLERVTGRSQERSFQSGPMKDGIEREDAALGMYEALTGRLVQRVGFVEHDELAAGCSPDGYIGTAEQFHWLVSAKCPIASTHLTYLQTRTVPLDYYRQITHELWITGAQGCDFLSYHPDFPDELQTLIVEVQRDQQAVKLYESHARKFLHDVDDLVVAVERLRAIARGEAA